MRKILLPLLLIGTLLLTTTCEKDDDHHQEFPPTTGSEYFGLPIQNHPPKAGLTLLKAESFQQTTEYTCGPASVVTLLKYYGKTADEMRIATEMGTSTTCGTTPQQMTEWLNNHGFNATWNQEGSLEMLRQNLTNHKPTLVEWSDWGGHWVLVIGYDTRNTESTADDVIIFADPYDRHDDHPDGLTWFNAERFYYMWYDALLFGSTMRRIFIEAVPQ